MKNKSSNPFVLNSSLISILSNQSKGIVKTEALLNLLNEKIQAEKSLIYLQEWNSKTFRLFIQSNPTQDSLETEETVNFSDKIYNKISSTNSFEKIAYNERSYIFPLSLSSERKAVLIIKYSFENSQSGVKNQDLIIGILKLSLDNSVLSEESERKISTLTTLYEIARKSNTLIQSGRILSSIINIAESLVSFDSAWFYTFDSKENCLFLAETKGTYTKPNEIFLNKIKENNLIFDLYADSEMEILTAQDKRPRLYHKDNFKSCMTIPIKSNTMLAGVLTLATEKQFAFKNEDLMALQLIADQVAEMNTLRETLINLKSSTDIILDSINAGLITIDMDGNLDYANTMARNYIHEISDRHIGKAADMIIKKTPFNNLLFNSLKSRQFINNKKIDFFHETKKLCFSVSTFPLKSGSFEEPTGIALFFKDITQEEFLKAELKRNESLSALGEMAAGVAHEIRNPLSGIKMVMQVLQSEFNIMDPRQEHINIVLDEVDRLAKIITDLMAFAKPRMLVLKNENIFTALKSALRMLAPEIKAKNIQIELYHDNQIILHDSERMVQVFLNVIKNAVDASFINSKIIVKIFYEINADTAKYLIIKIENSGNPIKNDEIEKIFNPFYTTKDSGTGLGLPITHSIIKEHKGKIHVKSTPQGDTEFKILIPLDINLNS